MHAVEIPEPDGRTPVAHFHATVNGRDQVVLGTIDGEVVAVAKLAHEHDSVVLRGVQVVEKWRGKGLGARLLEAVARRAEDAECFVIALGELETFYARAGFVRTTRDVPQFIVDRCAHYRSKGDDVFVARRPAGPFSP